MYKCPLADCTNIDTFTRYVEATAEVTLDRSGEETHKEYTEHGRRGHVGCKCGARAKWIDTRQVELFPVAPTLTA